MPLIRMDGKACRTPILGFHKFCRYAVSQVNLTIGKVMFLRIGEVREYVPLQDEPVTGKLDSRFAAFIKISGFRCGFLVKRQK